ncbi:TolC family protein [Herminiimonas fonticola]|uniref:Outer membrane protein TolC n=1 Tax=Herminiimonas fonticola TaxID=303380 RepID=A0A4R6GJA0_9BURK|nr:TolC family protein [Herminiimonas fonticola]RBA22866.1 Outer membrane efflux protein [Herminiimonas fonticola]TDN95102.1 outer membrane protein TolC [Herminiimonas fonticola]
MFLRIHALLNHQSRTLCRISVLLALAFGTSFVHAQSNGLTLNEALQLSLQRSSLTKAANASVLASRESAAKADQLPDPMLKVGIDNLPVTGSDRYSTTSDFMTMRRVGIEQQWVSSDKRIARSERAMRAVEMEESTYLESVAKVREEAAKAWVNVLYGQRTLALVSAMEKEAEEDLNAMNAAHRGAKANASDVMQAQLTLSQAQDATRKNTQDLKNARLALSRWTGMPAATVADETPKLTSHVPGLPVEELEKYHPMLLSARRAVNLADADSTVASRESNPDWSVEAAYSQRGSQYSNMVSFGISIPLAVNRAQKQNRDIAEKSALGTKARMQYEEALRELQTEIENQSSTLESLKTRMTQLNAQLLPPASQQVELATAAYRSGAGSLSAVFNAKKMLLERRLQIAELEREAALTWAALEYHVLPHDMASAGEMK